MIPLTEETAAAERTRLLSRLRFHRRGAAQTRRQLDYLDAQCRKHGIRLVREPVRSEKEETTDARPDPLTR